MHEESVDGANAPNQGGELIYPAAVGELNLLTSDTAERKTGKQKERVHYSTRQTSPNQRPLGAGRPDGGMRRHGRMID